MHSILISNAHNYCYLSSAHASREATLSFTRDDSVHKSLAVKLLAVKVLGRGCKI
jgi:hypothetical protein